MSIAHAIVAFCDAVNERVGRLVSWLSLAVVLVQFAVVVMRYTFGLNWLYVQESIVYMHATVFLVAAGYTLAHNEHVRIDIFYGPARPRTKAIVDLVGVLLLLEPFCIAIWVAGWPYVVRSWEVMERSLEVTGLPIVFLLKSLILVFATLLALQGVAIALRSVLTLSGGAPYPPARTDGRSMEL